jgi:DNA-binding NtrC family response regulator
VTIQKTTHSILVAEAATTSRSSLSELLREEGYRVLEASDSGTAVNELIRDSDIKVILADLEMPSWTSIIRHARSQLPESFVLGMLRYGAIANALEAQRLGVHAYFIKPLDFVDVNQWIRRYLTDQSLIKI